MTSVSGNKGIRTHWGNTITPEKQGVRGRGCIENREGGGGGSGNRGMCTHWGNTITPEKQGVRGRGCIENRVIVMMVMRHVMINMDKAV